MAYNTFEHISILFGAYQNVRELQDCIRAVVQTIDGNMLKRVWQQSDCRIDICRVTKGAHIERLWADCYW
jgi:hypothetical protein